MMTSPGSVTILARLLKRRDRRCPRPDRMDMEWNAARQVVLTDRQLRRQ
jgi:hypothetical protein